MRRHGMRTTLGMLLFAATIRVLGQSAPQKPAHSESAQTEDVSYQPTDQTKTPPLIKHVGPGAFPKMAQLSIAGFRLGMTQRDVERVIATQPPLQNMGRNVGFRPGWFGPPSCDPQDNGGITCKVTGKCSGPIACTRQQFVAGLCGNLL